jgi:Flp pilus assembly pilin Flp
VEYSLIVLLVAVSLIAILGLAGKTTKRVYSTTSSAIAVPASYGASGGGGPSPIPALVTRVAPPPAEPPPDSTANADSADSLRALAHSQ